MALITAVTTDTRLDKQLAQDREIKELELAHDRELRDVEELRSLLDDAAVLVADAIFHLANVSIRGAQGKPEDTLIEARKSMGTFIQKSLQATHMEQRIALRLGVDHEVSKAFKEVDRTMENSHESVDAIPLSESGEAAVNNAGVELNHAQVHFLETSRRYVGSQFRED